MLNFGRPYFEILIGARYGARPTRRKIFINSDLRRALGVARLI